MAKSARRSTTKHETSYKLHSDNPIESASKLYDNLRIEYGPIIILDQLLRLTKHCIEDGFNDPSLSDRLNDLFEESEKIEDACYRVSVKLNTPESKRKYELIRDIRSYAECHLK